MKRTHNSKENNLSKSNLGAYIIDWKWLFSN